MKKSDGQNVIQISPMQKGYVQYSILGTTPLILNRMSEKGRKELLLPRKKTQADRAANLKHDPYSEFLYSPYVDPDPKGPTLLQALAAWFKKAITNAALDVPGANKSQIGRLLWVEGERLPLYGTPQLKMDVTRNSDPNRTPDIRTRAILPRWACQLTISYIQPMLNVTSVNNLLISAGMSQGVAEWRAGKGSGTYGCFIAVPDDDKDFKVLLKEGRKVQRDAMDKPECYDEETADLYGWYQSEVLNRGKQDQVQRHNGAVTRGSTRATIKA